MLCDLGHALNKILKDIINRYHVSIGDRVHYIPGWDCHGLPIENKALKDLRKEAHTLPPNTIRKAAEATARREIETQKAEFQELGIMADWREPTTYRTLDHEYEIRQLRVFQKMVERGLIYRHYRPVHYSPSSRSALAEAELVYTDDHVSHSVYVTFSVETNFASPALQKLLGSLGETSARLLVWTTTPWTLTANMGIAVHPEMVYELVRGRDAGDGILIIAADRRLALEPVVGDVDVLATVTGSDLVDTAYIPIFSSLAAASAPLHILPSSHVTPDSGTGLVHCAPAHGAEDYNAFRALNLISSSTSIVCHVGAEGAFTDEVAIVVGPEAGKTLAGQEVLKGGSKAVVNLLEGIGALVKIEKIRHRYPYDWKTNEPIIVTATSQWFANLDGIKQDALQALEKVSFYPEISRNRLESFIKSRSEWCISRQRVWGVPIPSLHHIPTDRAVLTSESLSHILSVLQTKGVAHWWDGPVSDFLPPSLSAEEGEWRKGTDTMDVWFDSGSSWSQLPEQHADVCLEGSDQHRGWFQSQLLTAVGARSSEGSTPQAPYGTLITHGMVLDQEGKKMSKSLGNIVSPMTVIKGGKDKKKDPAYGADVLRLWAATVEYWRDMSIGKTILSQAAESLRKIRNSARFILGNIGPKEVRERLQRVEQKDMHIAERYVMHELYQLEQVALEGYANYNFPKVMNALGNFANITLSSLYFDITKDCLYADSLSSFERRSVVTVLEQVLTTMTRVMAPVLPHLAEEIHHTLQGYEDLAMGSSVFAKKWEPLVCPCSSRNAKVGSDVGDVQPPNWEDVVAEKSMTELLRVRSAVLALLEKARGDKNLKSSLEAEVDLILPSRARPIRR
ncbi:hypothetical protein EWM64_g848 [Hericium alpestre]|uniref:isoleucine--tRNA ligase n=1 Tax=Hericium alpestre TaxID=135208 RepID=A0A4Z0AB01_9AGAM|nr:hypothetical protein EWM64_g848 [Hericium alpestre]